MPRQNWASDSSQQIRLNFFAYMSNVVNQTNLPLQMLRQADGIERRISPDEQLFTLVGLSLL